MPLTDYSNNTEFWTEQVRVMHTYFTIRHADTHKPLGLGGPIEPRSEVVGRLRAARPQPLVLSEWYVTEWYGDGSASDEIIEQINAEEFCSQ